MSAALRETKTGPTFAETKLLAFLDARKAIERQVTHGRVGELPKISANG
jgi:hypothetical protein